MALKRSIGLGGLTFIGIGAVLGSGWLFAPLLAAQQAGPASLISWAIGGILILLVALPFVEIAGLLPEPGAIARLPRYSHGSLTSMIIGWSAWLGYATLPPIETVAILKYIGPLLPGIYSGGGGDIGHIVGPTPLGYAMAICILLLMVAINALGVAWLDKANAIITTVKVLVPLIVVLTFISTDFHVSNFTAQDGFAPYGLIGILGAISMGGVVFAYAGFRHIIDLAGEARRPEFYVPLALLLTVIACFVIYVLLQIAFIGGVPQDAFHGGWKSLDFSHHLGPMAGIAAVIGASWLLALLYSGAVLGPFGAALIATGSNARLGMALARNRFFPSLFEKVSSRGIPLYALLLGAGIGILMLTMPFKEMVALNSSAIMLSLCVGPLTVAALRRQIPDVVRPVRIPFVEAIAPIAFIVATLIIYWSGWNTIWRLDIGLVAGLVIFAVKLRWEPQDEPKDIGHARWLFLYIAGLNIVSALGNFGGGLGFLPFGWDMAVIAVIALVCYRIGLADALPAERTEELLELSFEGP